MKKPSLLALLAAGGLFLAFFANVALGALGIKPPLGDIQEMLLLLAAAILFVVSVLGFEAEDRRAADDTTKNS
ncbi:MAG: hypothetical protein ACR2PO_14480 [Methyloligellaceae bacterium]